MAPAPMTVAVVNANRKWGGVKTWTLDYGRALQARGHRIVAVVREHTPFVDACRGAGFRTYPFCFGPKYNPVAIGRLVGIFRRERPDVAVVNISKDVEIGGVAARLCGVPVLHRVGLVEDYRGTREERLRHRWLVDRVLVPAEWMRAELLRLHPWLGSAGITAIPNSKDVTSYPAAHGSGDGPVVFGVSSQLNQGKGHTHLLAAVQFLREKGISLRLRVAGTGQLESVLRAEVEERGISNAVEFVGFQQNMKEFLAALDAFVLPSLAEGFPNALLEAMCAGLAVVASDLPGTREMVGEEGVLAAPGDSRSLAEAVGKIVGNAELRAAMGRNARWRAEQHFDIRSNAGRLEALFRELSA